MQRNFRNFAVCLSDMAKIWDKIRRLRIAGATAVVALTVFASCHTTKFVPEGKYLLNKARIEVKDNPEISRKEMRNYLRQTQNHEVFGGWKLQLNVYNWSGRDSTKWYNKWVRKLGQAPVIYDPALTELSANQLRLALVNRGYLDTEVIVDTLKDSRKKKAEVIYSIYTNKPHYIASVDYNIPDDTLRSLILADSSKFILRSNTNFDRNMLDQARQNITDRLRNQGYFGFNKEYITFTADTTAGSRAVDLTMNVMPPYPNRIKHYDRHQPFFVRHVYVVTDYDPAREYDITKYAPDNVEYYKGLRIFYGDRHYLRPRIIDENCYITPGKKYDASDVDKTYQSFGRLGILKFININFESVGEIDGHLWVDSYILLTEGKSQTVTVSLEGTNSEGDLGFGVAATYQHRNLARGSETLTAKAGVNYESISGDMSGLINNKYAEYNGEVGIAFPKFIFPFLKKSFRQKIRANTEFSTSFTYQERPEYTRVIAGAGWKYKWTERGSMIGHTFDLLDINYVYLPKMKDEFISEIAPDNPLLRYSYEDHFIMKMGYTFYYTNKKSQVAPIGKFVYQPDIYTIRAGIETAGNLLYAGSSLSKQKRDPDSQAYKVFGIQYSQYVKLNLDYTYNHSFDRRNALVLHIGAGAAVPYGNSTILPFEKRFYSGGANSVRGWSVRTLGPGRFNGDNSVSSFMEQCGDIRLDLNMEYRAKLFWVFEMAAFIDAGNIWTIRSYENQPGGVFKFDSFYKEIAAAYGIGLRLNFNYFLLRLDCGMKAYNPALDQERWPLVHPNFKRDYALHFSVGYPF